MNLIDFVITIMCEINILSYRILKAMKATRDLKYRSLPLPPIMGLLSPSLINNVLCVWVGSE